MTSAIILAGGLGTRLRQLVPDLPKPMAPINGRPFLEYQLDYWIAQEVNHFVLSIGYLYETITDHFGDSYKDSKIDYVIENQPLGTGGGLLLALEKISAGIPFLLLNGDTFFEVDLKSLINFSKRKDADWCFSLFRSSEKGRYMPMIISKQGQITNLQTGIEKAGGLHNGGVYWVHPRTFIGQDFLSGDSFSLELDFLPFALGSGQRLFGMEASGNFIDIGIPSDYHRAAEILRG